MTTSALFRCFLTLSLIATAGPLTAQELESKLAEKRAASAARTQEVKADMQAGIESLRKTAQHERALALKGQRIPHLVFELPDGKVTNIAEYFERGPVVLNFYRGGWCPYCMLELQSYQQKKGEFEAAGATIIALSPDSYKEIEKTRRKYKLDYLVVSDRNNLLARRMGLAFKVDDKTLARYQSFGIDLEASQGNKNNELPMPGTYVIGKNGVIEYAFIDPDYTKRAEPSEVLKVVKKLGSKN